MATRLYFSSAEEAAVTPNTTNIDWWNRYDDFVLLKLGLVDSPFTIIPKTQNAEDIWGSAVLAAEFVSPPLVGSGTITNEFVCQFRVAASDAFPVADVENAMVVRIVSNDGSVDRTINEDKVWPWMLDDGFVDGTFGTTLTNFPYYSWPNDYYGSRSIDYQDGDRIVVDVGFNFSCMEWPDPCAPNIGYIEIGKDSATDLPEDDSTTDQFNPWIEFAEDLAFKDEEEPEPPQPPIVYPDCSDKQPGGMKHTVVTCHLYGFNNSPEPGEFMIDYNRHFDQRYVVVEDSVIKNVRTGDVAFVSGVSASRIDTEGMNWQQGDFYILYLSRPWTLQNDDMPVIEVDCIRCGFSFPRKELIKGLCKDCQDTSKI